MSPSLSSVPSLFSRIVMAAYSGPVYRFSLVRISTSPPLDFTEPPGRSIEACLILSAICPSVRLYCRRVSSFTSMDISKGLTPLTSAWVIPGIARSSSLMDSACSLRLLSGAFPYITIETTSRLFAIFETTGLSASSGRVVTRSISAFMSCRIRSMSSPSSISAVTLPNPSLATDVISFIPLTLLRLSSIFSTIPSSTSSGPAPG